ncbi:uncharacterized protein LOC131851276 [Achroia grisella]|uniref:uncharacterized protein LOC131845858 n=1 Tax=Achroia grisella TaxID=688607 RepID=UPI0027D265D9|nr:uncharacterized protein LOC131845858 [Achroia grisella]XP_059052428.1 uncharacterized protein LOC131847009 [Achroia grisella]XP_059052761.1 uncharacterized protein LOC131847251 [Achroia grisella]XP_059057737.1 uncharacterized protein LOC131851276 [Achroia grisella]
MVGVKMKQKEDLNIFSLLLEESRDEFVTNREETREQAKIQILKVQDENRRNYNKKRKESLKHNIGDYVVIKRTQFGTNMKLKQRYLGPYKVVKVNGRDRYDVLKVDIASEGPMRTSTSADYMKRWPEVSS